MQISDSACDDRQQQHNSSNFSKTCLEKAIKHVKNAKHVTGIAASVWGQIYKVEPAIVIELIQEQINNKLPDDVRQLLSQTRHAEQTVHLERPTGKLLQQE